MSVLFVSYTGLLEPLGASQVLPYVRGLSRRGHTMEIVSFEKTDLEGPDVHALREILAAESIDWRPRRYHKRPAIASTALDITLGVASAREAVRRGVKMLHARGHVPALMADLAGRLCGTPYLFDHRGLMADEFADAGLWPKEGVLYRATSRLERRFVRRAARVVVLTERYRNGLTEAAGRVTVIPCAVDLDLFRPASPREPRPFDLVYAGAWSGLYLTEETLRFFRAYRRLRPTARMLLLVASRADLRTPPPGVEVRHPAPTEVPALLRKARAGLSLRRVGRAQVAASPVKVSEYLATGLVVVSSPGVGDLDRLLTLHRAGVVVRDYSEEGLDDAAAELARLVAEGQAAAERCRLLAEEHYDLQRAIHRYDGVYRELLGMKGPA